jgi:hypothetical protein
MNRLLFGDNLKWLRDTKVFPDASVSELAGALKKLLRTSQMMAYLAMMAPHVVELHRVLKPTSSLYLHCV